MKEDLKEKEEKEQIKKFRKNENDRRKKNVWKKNKVLEEKISKK